MDAGAEDGRAVGGVGGATEAGSGGRVMDLTGKYLVIWLSAEAIETFLGVLEPHGTRPR